MEDETERTPLKDLANNYNRNTENDVKCESDGKREESRPGKRMSLLQLLDPLYDPNYEGNFCEDTLLEEEVPVTPITVQPVQEGDNILEITTETQIIVTDDNHVGELKSEEASKQAKTYEQIISTDNTSEQKIVPVDIDPIEMAELKLKIKNLQAERNAFARQFEEYEQSFTSKLLQLQNATNEYQIVRKHLSSLEIAFSDLLEKYERSKTIIESYQKNETTIKEHVEMLEDRLEKCQDRYEGLKTHATKQLELANQEMHKERASREADVAKYTAIIKRLEIKNESITQALDQKIKESRSLTTLIDEMHLNK